MRTDLQLAKAFMAKAEKYKTLQRWAIPPDMLKIFLGYEGLYPLFLLVKEMLEDNLDG